MTKVFGIKNLLTFSFTILPPFWQTWWFYSFCFIAFLSAVYSYLKIRASNKLIKKANQMVTQQNKIIEEKNHEIIDSINYAKIIQEAILPNNSLKEEMTNCFVYYKPKDIVSGDFFWFKNIEQQIPSRCSRLHRTWCSRWVYEYGWSFWNE